MPHGLRRQECGTPSAPCAHNGNGTHNCGNNTGRAGTTAWFTHHTMMRAHSVAVTYAPLEIRGPSGILDGLPGLTLLWFCPNRSHPGGASFTEGKCGKAQWPCGCPVCP